MFSTQNKKGNYVRGDGFVNELDCGNHPRCICTLNHNIVDVKANPNHIVHSKYIQFLLVNHTSIKLKKSLSYLLNQKRYQINTLVQNSRSISPFVY